MFHIAICEDEKPQKEYLVSVICSWQKKNPDRKIKIDTYDNGGQFLFAYEDMPAYDLLILDIEMGEMNGMELAKRVRRDNQVVNILFLTGYKDYVFEGYEVRAIKYLLKPLKEKELYTILDNLVLYQEEKQKYYFVFTYGGVMQKIEYEAIRYLEANGHYVILKTIDQTYEWKASISSLAQEFEHHDFIMIRRGLYVNLVHIYKIGRTECILDNQETLPISKNRYQELNQAFIKHYRGQESFAT